MSTIPGWPSPLAGARESLDAALAAAGKGQSVYSALGLHVQDVDLANTTLSSYAGSAAQLSFVKTQKQAALDKAFDANFDLEKFIRGGTATNITATNVGTFLATITNNYRTLRASIANAATVAAVNAVNINSGWPSNP